MTGNRKSTQDNMKVTVYTTNSCPNCVAAKEFLKANSVEFTEKNVEQDRQAAKEMIIRSGQRTVPVIDIDGAIVRGFDQDKLEELLGL
jgi:glutaredoxin 3